MSGTKSSGPRRAARWTDASRKALVGPDDLPTPIGIDTYTAAELLAAYPNGGAALLALAANTRVLVTDGSTYQVELIREPGGTYWKPVACTSLPALSARYTVPADTAENTAYSFAIPQIFCHAKMGLRWRIGANASAGSGATCRFKFGATQIDSNGISAGASLSSMAEYRSIGATNSGTYVYNLTYRGVTTFDTASGFTFSVTIQKAAGGDTVTLDYMSLELIA